MLDAFLKVRILTVLGNFLAIIAQRSMGRGQLIFCLVHSDTTRKGDRRVVYNIIHPCVAHILELAVLGARVRGSRCCAC